MSPGTATVAGTRRRRSTSVERLRSQHTRVQLQFLDDGHRALDVQLWLDQRFPHLEAKVRSAPGLQISLSVPCEHFDGAPGWPARMMEATSGIDLALEILALCFEEASLSPGELLAVHWTRAL